MRYLALALAGLVAACAPWTSAQMLDGQTATISARGGTINSQSDVTKALLQEAAKQAQKRGYDYFQVLQASAGGNTVMTMSPTTYVNTGGGTFMAMPGPAMAGTMPNGDIVVRFYKTRPDAPNVWEAKAVLAAK